MENMSLDADGNLRIVASKTSSPDDFDFMVGHWKIYNRKLKARLAGCTDWDEFEAHQEFRKILRGFGNIDAFIIEAGGRPFEGMTLRLFNPNTKLWSIYWADSNMVTLDVPQIGSFENRIGVFYARDRFEGKDIIVKFNWDATDPAAPVWSQAFSADEGQNWEWNWYMRFEKQS